MFVPQIVWVASMAQEASWPLHKFGTRMQRQVKRRRAGFEQVVFALLGVALFVSERKAKVTPPMF